MYYIRLFVQTHVDIDEDDDIISPVHKRGTSLIKRNRSRYASESEDDGLKRVGSVKRQISRQRSAHGEKKGDGATGEISEKDLEKLVS